ncbi:hypothetical protein [Petrachloros mirabilis]
MPLISVRKGPNAGMDKPPSDASNWPELEKWWIAMGDRIHVTDRARSFFQGAMTEGLFDRVALEGGSVDYILFVLMRYWAPTVLPPPGRERLTKHDPDYWLESEQILKSAAVRLRELKPLIDLLTMPGPHSEASSGKSGNPMPVAELELSTIIDGIAEAAGTYGGPDYTSIVKAFDPVPLRQTQPFKHNKKHSAELWVVFLLREHFRNLGLGKDRYWPLLAPLCTAAGIHNQSGQNYSPDELKSWWQKNWPRTYTQLEQGQQTAASGTAYDQDFRWFQAWIRWQKVGQD